MTNCEEKGWILSEKRILILSETAFLLFEPEKVLAPAEQYGKLLFYGNLRNLKQISRSKENIKKITFYWIKDNENLFKQILEIENSDKFIEKLLQNIAFYGGEINSNTGYINKTIPKKEEIKDILYEIEIQEKTYENNGKTESDFMKLMNLYQKTIEYYNSINSENYIIWMNKLKLLLESKK